MGIGARWRTTASTACCSRARRRDLSVGAESIPLTSSVDVVVARNSLDHVDDPQAVLNSARHAPGGRILNFERARADGDRAARAHGRAGARRAARHDHALPWRMSVAGSSAPSRSSRLRETVGDRFALIEFLFPHNASPPLHTHPQDETYVVLEGELTLQLGEERLRLGEGDVAVATMGTPHSFRVDSETARVLVLSTPAGLERMVRDGSVPATSPGLPPADAPRPTR